MEGSVPDMNLVLIPAVMAESRCAAVASGERSVNRF